MLVPSFLSNSFMVWSIFWYREFTTIFELYGSILFCAQDLSIIDSISWKAIWKNGKLWLEVAMHEGNVPLRKLISVNSGIGRSSIIPRNSCWNKSYFWRKVSRVQFSVIFDIIMTKKSAKSFRTAVCTDSKMPRDAPQEVTNWMLFRRYLSIKCLSKYEANFVHSIEPTSVFRSKCFICLDMWSASSWKAKDNECDTAEATFERLFLMVSLNDWANVSSVGVQQWTTQCLRFNSSSTSCSACRKVWSQPFRKSAG